MFPIQAILAQKAMSNIRGGVLVVGAWLGYGFHEGGFTSGLRAVTEHIDGVQLPFDIARDQEPHAVLLLRSSGSWRPLVYVTLSAQL